ncbi:MAG: MFS transporter [Pseudomonadota bacterium]
MSTISIVQKNSQVCIAADTLTSFGDLTLHDDMDRHSNKIQTFGDTHIGIVGSAAHTLVVESAFNRPDFESDFSSRVTIFETFLRLHTLLKEFYFLNPKDDDDDPYESTRIDCVIANASGIYAVYGLREVYEYEKFWAIGSGADYALGAMNALYESDSSAMEIARRSIETSARFCNATALPATFEVVDIVAEF